VQKLTHVPLAIAILFVHFSESEVTAFFHLFSGIDGARAVSGSCVFVRIGPIRFLADVVKGDETAVSLVQLENV